MYKSLDAISTQVDHSHTHDLANTLFTDSFVIINNHNKFLFLFINKDIKHTPRVLADLVAVFGFVYVFFRGFRGCFSFCLCFFSRIFADLAAVFGFC